MEKVGRTAQECIVIENAPLGVKAGKAAGCFVIGITTGPIPKDEMEKAGADLVFGSMAEFADALPTLIEAFRN
jgi:beta-phosphoglucomutase-like phosphatase (HAD superfamily)